MAESMARDGQWLFRHRSVLPILFVPFLVAGLINASDFLGRHLWQEVYAVGCLLVSLSGVLVRMLVVGYTPKGTSGRNTRTQVAQTLNTTGVYGWSRNPLYVGNYLIWLGIVLYPHDVLLAALFTAMFWLYYERIIAAEESFLLAEFGRAYREFAAGTACFVPRLSTVLGRGWRAPALPFSVRNCLKREYTAVLGTCSAFFLMGLGHRWFHHGDFQVGLGWVALFAFGVVQFFVLRTLKKRTRVLHVPGR